MNSAAPTPSIFDNQSLTALKRGLRTDDPQALKAAAQQFEAVFLQMMLKSMRATVPQQGMFDNDQTRFYQELLDSQLAQVMAAKGGTGLAKVIERQMSRQDAQSLPELDGGMPLAPPARFLPLDRQQRGIPLPAENGPAGLPFEAIPVRPAAPNTAGATGSGQPQAFVASVWPHAALASQQTGIPPQFLIAHAALESGWGRAEPRFADGRPSHNLFGIKAGSQWQGAVVEAATTEYVNGVVERRVERFRAYGSYAEAFQDYARLMANSPRYAEAAASRDAASFARSLQRAGYATDPAYAAKLERVISSVALSAAMSPKA
jgi:flagellar protein FlgJ